VILTSLIGYWAIERKEPVQGPRSWESLEKDCSERNYELQVSSLHPGPSQLETKGTIGVTLLASLPGQSRAGYFILPTGLIFCGCHNKLLQTGCLVITKIYSLTALVATSSKSWCWAGPQSFWRLQERILCLLASCGSRYSLTCVSLTRISPPTFTSPSFLHLLQRFGHLMYGQVVQEYLLYLKVPYLLTSAKILFPNTITFTDSRIWLELSFFGVTVLPFYPLPHSSTSLFLRATDGREPSGCGPKLWAWAPLHICAK
jgi:hypothetical protein